MLSGTPWFKMQFALPGPWPEKNFATDIELQDDDVIWEREPTKRPEPDPDEPLSHVGQVYEAFVPRWTKVVPRDEGLWFVREPGGSTRVMEVWREYGNVMWGQWTDLPARKLLGSGLEFSDQPIREPR